MRPTRPLRRGYAAPILHSAAQSFIESLEARRLLSVVVSGQEVSGNIASAGQQDKYTFTGTAGGTIEVSAGATSGSLYVGLDLYGPGGTLLKTVSAMTAGQVVTVSAVAPSTGTYYAIVRSADGYNGGYNISEASVPGTQALNTVDNAGGPISSGHEVSGNIEGQLDAYSFSGTAGGTIEISAGATSGSLYVGLDLYGPGGTLLKTVSAMTSGQVVTVSAVAPSTGTYYAIVRSADGYNGGYNISEASVPGTQALNTVDNAGGPISSGHEVSGNIEGQLDAYSFSGTAGGTIEISAGATSGSLYVGLDLYGPGGTLLKTVSAMTAGQVVTVSAVAPSTGTYYAIVRSADGYNGGYNISEASVPGTQALNTVDNAGGPISSGHEVSGNIEGQLDAYSFSGTAGGTIEISAGATSGSLYVGLDLYGPGGTLLKTVSAMTAGQVVTVSAVAPSTGTYYAIVRSADGYNGGYNISEASVPGTQALNTVDNAGGPISSGHEVSGNIEGQLDAYSFSGTAGGTIEISAGATSGSLYVGLDLYGPGGTLLKTVSAMTSGQVVTVSAVAPSTGTYYAIVRSADGYNGGYNISLKTASPPYSITVDPPTSQSATTGIAESVNLGSFTETGATSPYSVDVNWGDGSADTKFTQATAGPLTAESHAFAKAATDTVGVTITDAKGHVSNTATFKETISAGKLVFATKPTTGKAGVALSPTITVKVENALGNLLTSGTSNVTLALATFPTGGALTGTATAKVVNGIATFTGLSLKIAGIYTLKATDGALTAAISTPITISPAAAAKLVIGQQPTTGVAGAALSPTITVKVEDPFGNVVTSNTTAVKLALATFPAGGALTGTATATAVKGIATFPGLSLKIAGGYTLKATDGILTAAVSKKIMIAAAAAVKLVIAQQPTTGTHGVVLTPVFIVDVEDAFGNIVTANASSVVLALFSEPAGGILTGIATEKANKGVATFGPLSLSKAGAYILKATDGKLTAAISKKVTVK